MAALLDIMPAEPAVADGGPLVALVETIEQLSLSRSAEEVAAVVRSAARRACGADGVTVVVRDGDECCYVDEDAVEPLWKGRRFPIQNCISGWAMLNGQTAIVPDIYADDRIPHDAYRPTFVRSLVMTPVRPLQPVAAIGAYWAEVRQFAPDELAKLEIIARATATALENVRLIDSLRDALAERDSLIRELDHRVKNNLASVKAIAQQTLRNAASPERFNRAFSGRLAALARAHEMVARNRDGRGVSLGEALRDGAGEEDAGRVSFDGPEVQLAAEAGVNVLLAVHELAANARDHGALSAPDGRVEVVWSVAGGRLQLVWREAGGPPVAPPGRQGFGLRMVQTGLPRSLAGTASFDFAADGLSYALSVPLSAAVRVL